MNSPALQGFLDDVDNFLDIERFRNIVIDASDGSLRPRFAGFQIP